VAMVYSLLGMSVGRLVWTCCGVDGLALFAISFGRVALAVVLSLLLSAVLVWPSPWSVVHQYGSVFFSSSFVCSSAPRDLLSLRQAPQISRHCCRSLTRTLSDFIIIDSYVQSVAVLRRSHPSLSLFLSSFRYISSTDHGYPLVQRALLHYPVRQPVHRLVWTHVLLLSAFCAGSRSAFFLSSTPQHFHP
jgi:hypothetical protein